MKSSVEVSRVANKHSTFTDYWIHPVTSLLYLLNEEGKVTVEEGMESMRMENKTTKVVKLITGNPRNQKRLCKIYQSILHQKHS